MGPEGTTCSSLGSADTQAGPCAPSPAETRNCSPEALRGGDVRCPGPNPDVTQQQKTGSWPIPKRTAQPLGWSDARPCSQGGRHPKAQGSHEEQWELWDSRLRPAEALRPHVERRCQGAGELADTPIPKTGKEMVSAIVKSPEPGKRKVVQKLCPRPRTGGEAQRHCFPGLLASLGLMEGPLCVPSAPLHRAGQSAVWERPRGLSSVEAALLGVGEEAL